MTRETIYVGTSTWKLALLVIGCFLFVVGGIFLYQDADNWLARVMGITCILFFGIGSSALIYKYAIDRRPRIVIDNEGVTDRTLHVGRIEWKDIEGIELRSLYMNQFVVLQLRDSRKYVDRLSRGGRLASHSNKALGFGGLNLNLSLVNVDANEVFNVMVDRITQEAGRNQH